MKEVMMELELLYNKMQESNKEVEIELKNEDIPFAKILFAVIRGIQKSDLFDMNDEDLINHIRKIQILES